MENPVRPLSWKMAFKAAEIWVILVKGRKIDGPKTVSGKTQKWACFENKPTKNGVFQPRLGYLLVVWDRCRGLICWPMQCVAICFPIIPAVEYLEISA